ncbi:hypothetical protein [Elongatibacter sediminis]|uniref:EF-hand domain-containing protein n=1 Tax=Elongatibacter sediminis TaxID=3119006 RepID=A0AAW9RHU0_9GAMM
MEPKVRPSGNVSTTHARQTGATLVEMLVASLLSIVVSSTAIVLISDGLGNNARILEDTRLSNEMRRTMQIMSRDVRRAGYTAAAMWCLANTVCLPDASINLPVDADLPLLGSFDLPAGIQIAESNDCFIFEVDRNRDGTISADEYGAYRSRTVNGARRMEAWTGSTVPDCAADDSAWIGLTSSQLVDIVNFRVDDDQSVQEVVATDLLGNTTNQRLRRVRLVLQGRLRNAPEFQQTLETTIDVRNDILL